MKTPRSHVPLPRRRLLLAGGAALGHLAVAGCADDEPAPAAGTSSTTTVDDRFPVVYEGGATDEALRVMLAEQPIDDAAQATHFIAPSEGATVAAAEPFTFTWAVGPTARRDPGPLERVLGALLGVREAHAHGAPISGRAYYLVFRTASEPELLRVFTMKLEYTPSAAAWKLLAEAGEPIQVDVVSAIFDANDIAAGGGPFVGLPLHFGVG